MGAEYYTGGIFNYGNRSITTWHGKVLRNVCDFFSFPTWKQTISEALLYIQYVCTATSAGMYRVLVQSQLAHPLTSTPDTSALKHLAVHY